MVLGLGLLVNSPPIFGLVVACKGDFYSFVESSVVHLPLIGFGRLIDACRKKTLFLFFISYHS